jgi:protein gp37
VADKSAIEWTEATWNPTTGCDRISTGCDNCYALTLAKRLKAMGNPKYQLDGSPVTSGPGFGVAVHEDALNLPRSWRRPRRVFVNSMSDLSVGVTVEAGRFSPENMGRSRVQHLSRTTSFGVAA